MANRFLGTYFDINHKKNYSLWFDRDVNICDRDGKFQFKISAGDKIALLSWDKRDTMNIILANWTELEIAGPTNALSMAWSMNESDVSELTLDQLDGFRNRANELI